MINVDNLAKNLVKAYIVGTFAEELLTLCNVYFFHFHSAVCTSWSYDINLAIKL
jgi:hypothetical protein